MRDVLEVLSKLPPVAATWTGGQGYLIKRGVMGMHDYPLATENDVAAFNESHGVTPAQKQAMEVGCVAGWDAEGADLQGDEITFIYTAPFVLMLSVNASTEEEAARRAKRAVEEMSAELAQFQKWPAGVLTLVSDGELDLIEEQKP
jgi:hypothetical protein